MRLVRLVSVFLLLAAIAACAKPPTPTSDGAIVMAGAGGASARLYSVMMPDGTKCVALVGSQKAGLDCQFTVR